MQAYCLLRDEAELQSQFIKSCPRCQTPMMLRRVGLCEEAVVAAVDYYIYCRQCGYGPSHSFDSVDEIIRYWEEKALRKSS